MNHIELAARQLKLEEGTKTHVYKCPADKWTIGVGRNVQEGSGPGLRQSEMDFMLANDLEQYEDELCQVFPAWDDFLTGRKAALLNLRHQLGLQGLLNFRKMVAAINRDDWAAAGQEVMDSQMGRDPQLRERTLKRMKELTFG